MTAKPYFDPAFHQQVIDGLSSLGAVIVDPFDYGDVLGVQVKADGSLRYIGKYPAGMSVADIRADMRKIVGGEVTQYCIAPPAKTSRQTP